MSEQSTKPPIRPYVPLNVHSHYSILEAGSRVQDLVKIAGENNMPAMAINDHGVMYGAIEHYNACKAAGIKPIIGCEVYLIDGDIGDRASRKILHNLVLYAKDNKGYRNLVKIVSRGHLEGFYYKPRINWDILEEYREGIIALSGCLAGPIAQPILRGAPQDAHAHAGRLKSLYGEDFYIELHDHDNESEYRVSLEALKIAHELGIELVATNDSHYSRPQDMEMHEILLCLQNGRTLEEASARGRIYGPEYYIKNGDQMALRFQHLDRELVERAIDNTLRIAEKIDLKIEMGKSILPEYPLEPGTTSESELRRIVEDEAYSRFDKITPEIQERLDFELNIINQMGFPAYFLIVADFIRYSKTQGIPVGPGRGSAAGSLVAYTLGITNIDPLEHNLLFERFLNPERVSMPDIDIDFCIERREDVIRYVTERYGRDHVCQIITFGTLAARAALKGVARVLDIPYAESDKLAKMIPQAPGTKLKDALEDGMELKKAYDSDPKVKQLVDLALAIEGSVSNIGMHAAGVVISKDPLMDIVPIQNSKDGQIISQYPMGDLEKLGLLKMDFLGLRNLTIIDNTLNLVKTAHQTTLDIDHLPLDDEKVYTTLATGETDGVFQLESGGMKALVKDLRPSTFEDINALVALFRPGPLNSGMVKDFVDRKHGRAKVVYKHPDLEPILKDTYGTIVYQEQIMQIAQVLAGYSLGQADLLRRAMGKKKADVMAKERDGFLKGTLAHGVDEALANELFDTMSEFAAYCFNRSHSAAYALVAYQTAYLKTHYPVEYLSALLSSVRNDLDKIQYYILTARRIGIKILPPDIRKSGLNFTPDQQAIRFGLASVKNVGVGVVEAILAARRERAFDSLEDFFKRVDPKVLNRKTLESLVLCGAFDSFGVSRRQLFDNIETIVQFANKSHEQKVTGQVSLFEAFGSEDFSGLMLTGDASEYSDDDIQQYEKSLLGFYVSSHPLDNLVETLPLVISHTILELKELPEDSELVIGGLISGVQRKITKSNRPIAIGVLEDLTTSVEFVVFSDVLETLKNLETNGDILIPGRKVLISGKLQFRGDDNQTYSVVVQEIRPVETVSPLNLHFIQPPKYEQIVYLCRILSQNKGNNPVILNFKDGTRIKTNPKFWVKDSHQFIPLLSNHFQGVLQVG